MAYERKKDVKDFAEITLTAIGSCRFAENVMSYLLDHSPDIRLGIYHLGASTAILERRFFTQGNETKADVCLKLFGSDEKSVNDSLEGILSFFPEFVIVKEDIK